MTQMLSCSNPSTSFNLRYNEYSDQLYTAALSLHPHCSTLAFSGVHTAESIGATLLELAEQLNLGINPAQGVKFLAEYGRFLDVEAPYDKTIEPVEWWSKVESSYGKLKEVTLRLFSISPGPADVERFFSNLPAANTSRRSNLSVTSLAKTAKVKIYFQWDTRQRTAENEPRRKPLWLREHRRDRNLGLQIAAIDVLSLREEDRDEWDTIGAAEAADLSDFEGFEDTSGEEDETKLSEEDLL